MKVYVRENQLLLTGKAWEINYLLKQYGHTYKYVKDWINYHPSTPVNLPQKQ